MHVSALTNRDNRAYKLSYLRKFLFYQFSVALLSTYNIAKSMIYENIAKLHTAQFSGDFDVLLGGKTKQSRSTKKQDYVLNLLIPAHVAY